MGRGTTRAGLVTEVDCSVSLPNGVHPGLEIRMAGYALFPQLLRRFVPDAKAVFGPLAQYREIRQGPVASVSRHPAPLEGNFARGQLPGEILRVLSDDT